MRLRRLVALLTSASLLHLSVVADDAACATHGVDAPGAAAEHAMTSNMGDMHGLAMDAGVNPDTEQCETPIQKNCCEAQAGCSVSGAIGGVRYLLPTPATYASHAHHAPFDAPASFASPPEPPPPKA